MRYMLDSSAWIEYLNGGKSGEKVRNILRKERNEIITLALNISEVVSKVARSGKNTQLAFDSIISNAKIIDVSPKVAMEAGILHSRLRKQSSSISIADTLMMASAEAFSARILTKDRHFKNFKGAVLI